MLGVHALMRGYAATLFTFKLQVFDPTRFGQGRPTPAAYLTAKLRAQAEARCVDDARFRVATDSYLEFLDRGGAIRFRDLTTRLIAGFIRAGRRC